MAAAKLSLEYQDVEIASIGDYVALAVSLKPMPNTLYIGLRCGLNFQLLLFPHHFQQIWNGSFFEKTTLRSLGLRVQLGHGGGPCPIPEAGPVDFLVIDTTGFHPVSLDYCGCGLHGFLHRRTQLLRAQWFPATFDRPQTAFTFAALDFFHELTLQGKTTLYDFYHTLLRLTDNAKLQRPIVSRDLFVSAQDHRTNPKCHSIDTRNFIE